MGFSCVYGAAEVQIWSKTKDLYRICSSRAESSNLKCCGTISYRRCYCIVWIIIGLFWKHLYRFFMVFRLLFLHVETLISFSRRLAEWRLCSKLSSSPPQPPLSCWNRSKIRREFLQKSEREKKAFAHSDWMMDFIWSLFAEPEPGSVGLLCRFLWWKTHAMPDLTSTRNKKKKRHVQGRGEGGWRWRGGGRTRETRFQELGGCGITESETRQKEVYVQQTETLKQRRSCRDCGTERKWQLRKVSQVEHFVSLTDGHF